MRPPDGRRRGLRQPDVADLAGLHQLGHRTDRLLDRHVRVHPVQVVQVDDVGAEVAQRPVGGAPDVGGGAVAAVHGAVVVGLRGRLGGQDDLVAAVAEGAGDQLLVLERPVRLCRVDEGDAGVDGVPQGRDGLPLVGAAVEGAHAHRAEAERGHGQPVAEWGGSHGFSCSVTAR